MIVERELLKDAANFLVRTNASERIIADIVRIADTWSVQPMIYEGPLSPLNTLVNLAIADRERFNRIVGLVRRTREKMPKARTNAYQAEFMAKTRERERKALRLHERETEAQTAAARLAYLAALRQRWAKARNEMLDTERAAYSASGKPLPRDRRYAAIAAFWAKIDAVLDQRLVDTN